MKRTVSIGVVTLMLALVPLLFLATFLGAVSGAQAHEVQRQEVPTCRTEEQIMVGKGDYSHGLWERYRCVHPDTYFRWHLPDSEGLHEVMVDTVCEYGRHWWREHGVEAIPEACYHDA